MSDDETPDQQVLAIARQLVAALATDPASVHPPTALGRPILAWTLEGRPAYWVFPLLEGAAPAGSLRLDLDGEVVSISHRPGRPAHATTAGIDQDEALHRAEAAVVAASEIEFSAPRLVMDGYPGREAWLVEVRPGPNQIPRRLLISSAGVQELS